MSKNPHLAALLAGRIDDAGFMEAGYLGLTRARDELGLVVSYIDGVPPQHELLAEALRKLARSGAALVIAHGGQNNEAAAAVAAEFPATQFAVTQGNVKATNLASYDVLQEQSAWLAGAAAGLLTRANVVGHISGIRVVPGLKGRAAFAAGLKTTNSRAMLLTCFCGTQDDAEVARRIAQAEIEAGADIIFTMLNAGMPGAIAACAERGVKQIGNVFDWTAREPDVFIGSAVADVGRAVYLAACDFTRGDWTGNAIKKVGLEDPTAVRLALASSVAQDVAAEIEHFRNAIIAGDIQIPEHYDGPEFRLS